MSLAQFVSQNIPHLNTYIFLSKDQFDLARSAIDAGTRGVTRLDVQYFQLSEYDVATTGGAHPSLILGYVSSNPEAPETGSITAKIVEVRSYDNGRHGVVTLETGTQIFYNAGLLE